MTFVRFVKAAAFAPAVAGLANLIVRALVRRACCGTLGVAVTRPETGAIDTTRSCVIADCCRVLDGLPTDDDRRAVIDVLAAITAACGQQKRAPRRGCYDGADSLVNQVRRHFAAHPGKRFRADDLNRVGIKASGDVLRSTMHRLRSQGYLVQSPKDKGTGRYMLAPSEAKP